MLKERYIEKLTKSELLSLKNAMKDNSNSNTRFRAHAIILSSKGYSINTLSDIFDVDRDTISIWMNSWEDGGINALFDEHRSGRPKLINDEQENSIEAIIKENPRSAKKILDNIKKKLNLTISLSTLKRIVKKIGFSWKRIRKSVRFKRDSKLFEKEKKEIENLVIKHNKGELDLYFFDQSGFSLESPVPYAYQKTGERIDIPCSKSGRLNVLGMLSPSMNFKSMVYAGIVDAETTIDSIDIFIKNKNKFRRMVIIMDNAPMHHSEVFQDKIIEWFEKGVEIRFLPPYSPELNKIEILWRFIKYQWLPFSAYENFEKLTGDLCDILKNIGVKYQINFG